jgi:hypothetical protein
MNSSTAHLSGTIILLLIQGFPAFIPFKTSLLYFSFPACGTGKDVSDENLSDATEPLKIKWYNDNFIRIPVKI